jgi:hypothetical protein
MNSRTWWLVVASGLSACTPVLDWREVRPTDSGAVALFPCKPQSQSRQVRLASTQVQMVLFACSAGEATWALAFADLGDPSRVTAALDELRDSAIANLGATVASERPSSVAGATPNPSSRRLQLHGKLSDGRTVVERLAVFAKGTRVFQATVLGERVEQDPAENFFASLKLER